MGLQGLSTPWYGATKELRVGVDKTLMPDRVAVELTADDVDCHAVVDDCRELGMKSGCLVQRRTGV